MISPNPRAERVTYFLQPATCLKSDLFGSAIVGDIANFTQQAVYNKFRI